MTKQTILIHFTSQQVRLTISLTTLLVLYTLFSQTSSALPKTSYIKMVDIWFFFCISTLFFIIILHVIIERVGTETDTVSVMMKGHLMGFPAVEESVCLRIFWRVKRMLMMPTDPPERVLFIARAYIIPCSVIPFTIVFWLLMK